VVSCRVFQVGEDHRDPAPYDLRCGLEVSSSGEQDAADPLFHEDVEIVGLFSRILSLEPAHERRPALLQGTFLHSTGHFGEERVTEMRQHQRHYFRGASPELTCRAIANETEFANNLFDSIFGGLGHKVRAIDDV
jgi:hypothetical protein